MRKVTVDEAYQTGYSYTCSEPVGEHFDPAFQPDLTPKQMLQLGIFGGNYFNTIPNEFPEDWFVGVNLAVDHKPHKDWNYFGVNASQPLQVWQQKGWIYFEDPKGWFLWYCRYYQGRRIPEEDARQIKRWKNMKRHASQLKNACAPGDKACRPVQRQALLHWAYDSRTM